MLEILFGVGSLHVIISERKVRKMEEKTLNKRIIVDGETGEAYVCHVLTGSGRGRQKKLISAFMKKYEAGSFWTLGTNWGVGEYEKLQKAWDKFAREIPGSWIAVVEAGEKGGKLHLHMCSYRYWEVQEVRGLWERATGIKGVHVDVRQFYGDGKARTRYLCKYLTKSEIKGRTFRSSAGLRKELEEYMSAGENETLYYIRRLE